MPAAGPQDELDVRLAVAAGGAWLAAVLLGNRSLQATVTGCALALGTGVIALALCRRRATPVASTLAALCFCVAIVLLPLAGRIAHSRDSPLMRLAAERSAVTVELTVSDDPRTLAAKGPAGSPRMAVRARAAALILGGRRVATDGDVLVLGPAAAWSGIGPGQRVRVDGTVQPSLDRPALSVTLIARADPTVLGAAPWWQNAATDARAALREASSGLPPSVRGLLPGLVVGDTTRLDPVLAEHFRLAGLTHLVAVSGTNCSILIGFVLLFLRRIGVRPGVCAVVAGLVLLGFVVLARPSPSVLRAAAMAAIALVALAAGRPRQALPALSGAVLVLLVWQPQLATDYGFAMSVLATAALLVLAPPWARALQRRRVPPLLAESVAVAAAAHVVTAPIIAALAGQVSLVAVPANVLAEVAVAPATVLGFGAAVLAPVWLPAGRLLAELAGWPCRWLVAVADYFGGLHGATVPWPGGLAGGLSLLAVSAAVAALLLRPAPRRLLTVAALAAVLVQIPVRSATSAWPPPGWILVACDVGQGDALVLHAGAHAAVQIDTGPDPVAVDRCLRDLGITDVAVLAISHYHLDHVAGLAGVLRGRHVGRVLAGPLDDPESGLDLVTDQLGARGLTPAPIRPGLVLDVGDIHLESLAPPIAFHGTRSDPNNSSLVLRATVAGRRILLPGDVEIEAQQSMLAAGVDVRADVLKVPHHGSAYVDPDFLAAVHAQVGVISVGLHNDYGHPSPILLRHLARLGVPARRTDRDGDVAVTARGGALATVVRGTRASTVGLPRWSPACAQVARAAFALPAAVSPGNARMGAWPPAQSASMTCPTSSLRCSCSSGTRNCWSAGRSARSPPLPAAPTRAWSTPNWPVPTSTAASCTS